jgi:hypothetical protein
MILTNIETVPGKRIVEHYGIVSGSTVQLRDESKGDIAERTWFHSGKELEATAVSLRLIEPGEHRLALQVDGPPDRSGKAASDRQEVVVEVVPPEIELTDQLPWSRLSAGCQLTLPPGATSPLACSAARSALRRARSLSLLRVDSLASWPAPSSPCPLLRQPPCRSPSRNPACRK